MYDGSWFQLFYFLSKFFTIIIQVFFISRKYEQLPFITWQSWCKGQQKQMLTTSVRRPIVLATFACGSKKICNSSTEKRTGWFLLDEILCPFFLKEYRSSSLAGLDKKQRPCVIVYAIVLLVCLYHSRSKGISIPHLAAHSFCGVMQNETLKCIVWCFKKINTRKYFNMDTIHKKNVPNRWWTDL